MSDQNVFERVEKKYRLNQKQYDSFRNAAAKKLHMDEYGLHTMYGGLGIPAEPLFRSAVPQLRANPPFHRQTEIQGEASPAGVRGDSG